MLALQTRGEGLDAGDILSFFGGIVGTGQAVAGAVWIEDRKRKAEIVEGSRPVLDALLALERKSRPFFYHPGERHGPAQEIDAGMHLLDRLLPLAQPRSARLIALFDRLKYGAAFLSSEHFLRMDAETPLALGPDRQRVEAFLELFDAPLKLLIIEYSRLIDPKSVRAVSHLGEMPEP